MKFISLHILLLSVFLTAIPAAWSASPAFDQSKVMVKNARLSDAEEMLQQWLGSHPEDQEARFLLARIFVWQGKHSDALREYRRLLQTEPDNGEYLEGRALLQPSPASRSETPIP